MLQTDLNVILEKGSHHQVVVGDLRDMPVVREHARVITAYLSVDLLDDANSGLFVPRVNKAQEVCDA